MSTSNLDVLRRVRDNGGLLEAVIKVQIDQITVAYVHFRKLSLSAIAREDMDNLELTTERDILLSNPYADVSNQPPWESVVGKELFSGWQLQNESSLIDGVRFAFGDISELREIELIVCASEIDIYWCEQTGYDD